MYQTLILIDPDATITSDAIEAALEKIYPRTSDASPVVTRSGSTFKVTWPGFFLELHRSELPHVLEESEEIAQQFASGRPEQDRISRCDSRVEIAGGDDPGMDYFNDYCVVVGEIEGLGTVYTFDQGSAEFMNL